MTQAAKGTALITEWFRQALRRLDEAAHYWEEDPLEQLEQRIRRLEEAGQERSRSQHRSAGLRPG